MKKEKIEKEIVRISSGYWNFEDYKEEIYQLNSIKDIDLIKDYIKHIKEKYGADYKYWEGQDAIKGYIVRTLKGTYLNDKGEILDIN